MGDSEIVAKTTSQHGETVHPPDGGHDTKPNVPGGTLDYQGLGTYTVQDIKVLNQSRAADASTLLAFLNGSANDGSRGDTTGAPPEAGAGSIAFGIKALHDKHGVDVVAHHRQYQYHLRADGKNTVLFSTENTPDGLKAAEIKLRQMETQRISAIEHSYNVHIAREGEPGETFTQKVKEGNVEVAKTVTAPIIQPTLGQLRGVESALQKAMNGVPSGDPTLVLRFIDGQEPEEWACFQQDQNGARIVIDKSVPASPPTEKDVDKWPEHSDSGWFSLEGTLIHEITHYRQTFEKSLPEPKELRAQENGSKSSSDEYAEKVVYPRIGWQKKNDQWFLQGKDGSLYKLDASEQNWRHYNQNGDPIAADGKVTDADHAQLITNDQAYELAKIKPSSHYFTEPCEMHAEAEEYFVSSKKSRANFCKTNPELYAIIKQLDQEYINTGYPPVGGEPSVIRSPEGLLVFNTTENRKMVEHFERRSRSS